MKKILLLIPSVLKRGMDDQVAAGRHPMMDYYALANALRERHGCAVDFLDYAAAEAEASAGVRLARKLGGLDGALAWMGFQRRGGYDSVFTNGENVGIPLALLLRRVCGGPRHVTIGHRLSTGKKQVFFTRLKVQARMNTIFVYAAAQEAWAVQQMGIAPEKLALIPFHADSRFYCPQPGIPVRPDQICSAGLEWRDYPTLIDAVQALPDLSVRLAAASPWSKHDNETAGRTLPAHVEARRYSYSELRELYAASSFVVVPLKETDFQAGVTTILEAMAMGKAVIATRTTGQTDVITDGENGLTVAPGDVSGWRKAICRLRDDAALRAHLGGNARRWVESHATLDKWSERVAGALSA